MKPRLGCKVYGSLLALCYLEVSFDLLSRGDPLLPITAPLTSFLTVVFLLKVVLWTSCVLVSFVLATTTATTDSHEYIVRETVSPGQR